MSRLTRSMSSELRKVRATKLWWILALVLAGYSAMMAATFAFIFSSMGEALGSTGIELPAQQTAGLVYSSVTAFGYVIPLLLGALMVTGELRHRTLGLTFTLEPRRGVVLVSKSLVLLAVGLLLGVLGLIGAVAAGAPVLVATEGDALLDSSETWLLFARIVAAMAIWAIIGFGVGILVRNQAFAIVLALVFTQFLEPVLRAAAQFWEWSAEVAKYLPGAASDAFVGSSAMNDLSSLDPTMPTASGGLGMWGGLAILLAYAVVAVCAGWLVRWRRDIG
ncbi:ABC transporter permease subunit [Leucobacter insecticola]|uniref:ABC transporter permease subunit n=1 Tax=Leucobacter insecticola TaxID=2714934 RepID=A0A6G8FGL8_9MICO|nr:ABC transporter permease [Leucobacter insecticola]QIM15409.1 ABC transporter permease subunit [Leucobacter insecticola]